MLQLFFFFLACKLSMALDSRAVVHVNAVKSLGIFFFLLCRCSLSQIGLKILIKEC